MSKAFVLDASAIIAFLADEDGAAIVDDLLRKAKKANSLVYMNKLNLLEVYYGIYRADGEEKALETMDTISKLPISVVGAITDDLFNEAGRLKATYKISLADSIAVAEAKTRKAQLLTSDHHELDSLEEKGEARFYWIR